MTWLQRQVLMQKFQWLWHSWSCLFCSPWNIYKRWVLPYPPSKMYLNVLVFSSIVNHIEILVTLVLISAISSSPPERNVPVIWCDKWTYTFSKYWNCSVEYHIRRLPVWHLNFFFSVLRMKGRLWAVPLHSTKKEKNLCFDLDYALCFPEVFR